VEREGGDEMACHLTGSHAGICSCELIRINAFGISYGGRTGLSTSRFPRAA
jgi:hypothetical protein